ncbi:MAG: PAS domain S-box protein, partial [Candidatus Hydrogenedentales bacterium]
MDIGQVVFMGTAALITGFVAGFVVVRRSRVFPKPSVALEDMERVLAALRAENESLGADRARLGSIMDNMRDMVSETTVDGIIRFASPSHKTILGFDESELVGKPVFDFVHPDDAHTVRKAMKHNIRFKKPGVGEFRCRHADGRYIWLRTMSNVIVERDGSVSGFIFGNHDITEWKLAEEALRESEERFRASFEFAPDATTLNTRDGMYVDCNKATEALLGYSREEMVGHSILEFGIFDEEQLPFLNEVARNTKVGMGVYTHEVIVRRKSGERLTIELHAHPIRLQGRDLILGIGRDVTQRRAMEEALRASEARNRAMLSAVPDLIFVLDASCRFLDVHASGPMALLVSAKRFAGKHVCEVLPQDLSVRFEPRFQRVLRTGRSETLDYHFDFAGRRRHYHGRIVNCEDDRVLVLVRDVTTIKQAEEALRTRIDAEALVSQVARTLLSLSHEHIDSGIVEALRQAATSLGADHALLIHSKQASEHFVRSHAWSESDIDPVSEIPPSFSMSDYPWLLEQSRESDYLLFRDVDALPPEAAAERAGLANAGVKSVIWIPIRTAGKLTGGVRFLWRRAHAQLHDSQVVPFSVLGDVLMAALQRAHAETQLTESEERYRHLFNDMLDGFALHEIICDGQGRPCDYRFLEVNPAYERLTGLKAADIEGRRVLEVLPLVEPEWIERLGEVAVTGQPSHFERYSKEVNKHFLITAYCPSPGKFAVIMKDTTERRRAEEALSESEAKWRTLVHNFPDRVILCNSDGFVQFANQPVSEFRDMELVGRRLFDLVGEEHCAIVREALSSATKTGQSIDIEVSAPTPTGEMRWLLGRVSVLRKGQDDTQFVITIRDITERKEAELERRKL